MRTIIQSIGEIRWSCTLSIFGVPTTISDGGLRVAQIVGQTEMDNATTIAKKTGGRLIVAAKNFILATREVGYRSLADAIAELIDNAIQAQARSVQVFLFTGNVEPTVAVLDDGCGMSAETLGTALQFGGTDRFDDRSGLGRFGMGLPCSSVSQARRLDVYSWLRPGYINYSYLDIDEILAETLAEIPRARLTTVPDWAQRYIGKTGTLVVWQKCDKIVKDNLVADANRLHTQLGRMFRYFIWGGTRIMVNGHVVVPIDPLFCHRHTPLAGAKQYGTPLVYKIRIPNKSDQASTVRVRFSELPVAEWQDMPIQEKRRFGIVKGAGVSLVRAQREIAYGWYFLGDKRRENYDDWWRCEIAFDPELDEYFHPTHTKQEIYPGAELEAVLNPDLEALARTLNSRVRKSFVRLKAARQSGAARLASLKEKYLPPLRIAANNIHYVAKHNNASPNSRKSVGHLKYSLSVERLREDAFYSFRRVNGGLVLMLNKDHAFFERIYSPLCHKNAKQVRDAIECLLFALVRAEAEAHGGAQRYWYNRKRNAWSNVLATFLGS